VNGLMVVFSFVCSVFFVVLSDFDYSCSVLRFDSNSVFSLGWVLC